jgi:hypothetical protein
MDNTRPNNGHRARPYRSGGPVRAGSSIAGPVDVVGSAWWYSIAGSALLRGQHLGAIVVIGWSPLTASAGHRCGSGLPNVTVTALPGGGWSGCSGRVPAVRGGARLPVGFSGAGCRVAASGRLISEIRGKVFGKREVFLLDLRTLPGGAPARPARLGRLPEITDIPVFSATMQRTAVHHLPLPSRYMRQSHRCCQRQEFAGFARDQGYRDYRTAVRHRAGECEPHGARVAVTRPILATGQATSR